MVSGSSSPMNVGTVLLLPFHSPLNLVSPSFPRITVAPDISGLGSVQPWSHQVHTARRIPPATGHPGSWERKAFLHQLQKSGFSFLGTVGATCKEISMGNVPEWEASEGSYPPSGWLECQFSNRVVCGSHWQLAKAVWRKKQTTCYYLWEKYRAAVSQKEMWISIFH